MQCTRLALTAGIWTKVYLGWVARPSNTQGRATHLKLDVPIVLWVVLVVNPRSVISHQGIAQCGARVLLAR